MTDSPCLKCGKCCEILPILVNFKDFDPESLEYLKQRGVKLDYEQNCLLIPSRCIWLLPKNDKGEQLCMIYDKSYRPNLCIIAEGQKAFWTPKTCGYRQRHKSTS